MMEHRQHEDRDEAILAALRRVEELEPVGLVFRSPLCGDSPKLWDVYWPDGTVQVVPAGKRIIPGLPRPLQPDEEPPTDQPATSFELWPFAGVRCPAGHLHPSSFHPKPRSTT